MKVLFINPPGWNLSGQHDTMHPVLGIMYLATILDRAGYDSKVIDAEALVWTWDQLARRIAEEKPDVIGLTSTTLAMPALYKTAEVCRQALPNVKILAGGYGPTLEPEKTLNECRAIDIACLRESEISLVELIKCLEVGGDLSAVKGIAYRNEAGMPVRNELQRYVEDLDSIPFPDYNLLEPSFSSFKGMHGEYDEISSPNAMVLGSRGCPHRCIFCCCNTGSIPRFRSPKNIADEIEMYKKDLKVKSIFFDDNEFIGMTPGQNKWVSEICDEIIKRGLDDLRYICVGRCSKFVELGTLKKMHQAGFRWIFLGVESGSQKILNRIQKDLTINDIKYTFNIVKQSGLKSLMFIMTGFPDETKEDFNLTCKIIDEAKPDRVSIHIATPMPGSKLCAELSANGQIDTFDYSLYNSRGKAVHHTNTMTSAQIRAGYQYLLFRYELGLWRSFLHISKLLISNPKYFGRVFDRIKTLFSFK
ncbi:MAG: radical SAM protein [Candidatus Buchananbacteria bacterium]|jgi:radical SAM superfamily enzyme YgiQ (UPF0313 family)